MQPSPYKQKVFQPWGPELGGGALAPMVASLIDKCSQCMLIWDLLCSVYKEKYMAVFSKASDPTRFAKVYDTEDEARQLLWDVYS